MPVFFVHGVDDAPSRPGADQRRELYEKVFHDTIGKALGLAPVRFTWVPWGDLRPRVTTLTEPRHGGAAHGPGDVEEPEIIAEQIAIGDLVDEAGDLDVIAAIEAVAHTLYATGARANAQALFEVAAALVANVIDARLPAPANWQDAAQAIDDFLESVPSKGVAHDWKPRVAVLKGAFRELGDPKGSLTRNAIAHFADPKWIDQTWYWGVGRQIASRFVGEEIAKELVRPGSEPVIILAHSHGGAVIVDALNAPPLFDALVATKRAVCLAVIGSQLGVFRDLGLLAMPGDKYLPAEIEAKLTWKNLYDRRDPFAFPAGQDKDVSFNSGQYFPWSHTEYLASPSTYERLLPLVRQAMGGAS